MKNRLSRSMLRRATAGFTLLEVIVVVVIVGILAAILAPGWLAMVNRQRAGAARDDLVEALRTAQNDAKSRGVTRTVTFDTTVDPPTITYNGQTRNIGGEAEIKAGQIELLMQDGVGAVGATMDITFNPRGGVDAPDLPASLAIGIPNTDVRRCAIVETLIGNVRTATERDNDPDNTCTF